MREDNIFYEQENRQKSNTRNTTSLRINPIKSIDGVDTKNGSHNKDPCEKILWKVIDLSGNTEFLIANMADIDC